MKHNHNHLSFTNVLLFVVLLLFFNTRIILAQSTTNSSVVFSPPPSTTTNTFITSNSPSPSDNNNFIYGEGIILQPNTSLFIRENKCMSLNSDLKHPDLKQRGADIHAPICIPTTATRTWKLVNNTASINKLPSDDQIDNCIATCNMVSQQRSSTVTVIYTFGQCYCWDQDFHEPPSENDAAAKECCKDGKVYEDYALNSACVDKMYANVFITTLLCPLNVSFCSKTTLAKEHCESGPASVTNENTGLEEEFQCCVPEGSLESAPSWGLQVAQYTIIIICVLALFQVLYWIFRKKRDAEDDEEEEQRRREQPRLLIVPTAMSSSTTTGSASSSPGASVMSATETQTITQAGLEDTHAMAAAREIIKLYKALRSQDISRLEGTGQEDCSICIDPLGSSESVRTPCEHNFHRNCLYQYITHKLRDRVRQVTCPVCRAVLVDASINEEDQPPSSSSSSPPRNSSSSSSPTTGRNGERSERGNRNDTSSSTTRRNNNSSNHRRTSSDTNPLQNSLLSSPRNNTSQDEVEMRSARGGNNHNSGRRSNQLTPRGASALL